jgi:predicted protein tyrosine phosphatase
MGDLTHLDQKGQARMVDVGAKPVTAREAVAEGRVRMNAETFRKALDGDSKKGSVRAAAEFAGIVREVAALEGGVLIHCAQGHGRSAALAAALLIARGVVEDLEGAERLLIASRPKVRLKPSQRTLVRAFAARQHPAPLATASS